MPAAGKIAKTRITSDYTKAALARHLAILISVPPLRQPPASPLPPFSRGHLVPGTRVAVALSGGADSTALLRLLHAANQLPRDPLGIGLAAIHIHHNLRGPLADRDQQFCADLCAGLDIPLILRSVDTPTRIATERESTEDAARQLRYAAFHDLLDSGDADVLVTAHTSNDQAETVLLKLLRGAWTEGLAAIYPVVQRRSPAGRVTHIVRPLLRTARADLETFLHSLHQPWVEDETNQDPAFTRNRLRHDLLPALRAFNPSLDDTLGNLADLARDDDSFFQAEIARLLPQAVLPGKPTRGGGRSTSTAPGSSALAVQLERLSPLSLALQRRLLRAAARQLGVSLSFSETARLLAFAGLAPALPSVPSRPGATLELGNGLLAERSLRELRLSRRA